jgi:hypothetical protein
MILVLETSSFLMNIPQPHSSKLMTTIQPSGVQWVVNLLQLKMEYSRDIFIPRVQPQETNVFSLRISRR